MPQEGQPQTEDGTCSTAGWMAHAVLPAGCNRPAPVEDHRMRQQACRRISDPGTLEPST
jgi:hypothetical protein